MAWSAADITALEAAVKTGVLKVRYSDREVTYQSLDAMRALLAEMRREVNEVPAYRRIATRKGFDL